MDFEKKTKITEEELKEAIYKLGNMLESKEKDLEYTKKQLQKQENEIKQLNELLQVDNQPSEIKIFMHAGFTFLQAKQIVDIIERQLTINRKDAEIQALKNTTNKQSGQENFENNKT